MSDAQVGGAFLFGQLEDGERDGSGHGVERGLGDAPLDGVEAGQLAPDQFLHQIRPALDEAPKHGDVEPGDGDGAVGLDKGPVLAVGGKDVFEPIAVAERGGGELAAARADAPNGDGAVADDTDAAGVRRRVKYSLAGSICGWLRAFHAKPVYQPGRRGYSCW